MKKSIVVVISLTALVLAAAVSAGNGGNAAAAKLCQKGGWQDLYRGDGTSFASSADCVSHAAMGKTVHGGKLTATTEEVVGCSWIVDCYWSGQATGVGLLPGSTVYFSFNGEPPYAGYFFPVADDGTFLGLMCCMWVGAIEGPRPYFTVYATDRLGKTVSATAYRGRLVYG